MASPEWQMLWSERGVKTLSEALSQALKGVVDDLGHDSGCSNSPIVPRRIVISSTAVRASWGP